jgi:hypothetical protein
MARFEKQLDVNLGDMPPVPRLLAAIFLCCRWFALVLAAPKLAIAVIALHSLAPIAFRAARSAGLRPVGTLDNEFVKFGRTVAEVDEAPRQGNRPGARRQHRLPPARQGGAQGARLVHARRALRSTRSRAWCAR